MTTDEIAEIISIGLDPNGETGRIIIARLRAADELARECDMDVNIAYDTQAALDAYRNAGKVE